jgi:hypothetical protein
MVLAGNKTNDTHQGRSEPDGIGKIREPDLTEKRKGPSLSRIYRKRPFAPQEISYWIALLLFSIRHRLTAKYVLAFAAHPRTAQSLRI